MISFLQNILQKHHKWLLSILLLVIVIAFVFTIGASPGIGKSNVKHIYFYGYDLANASDVNELVTNAVCTEFLSGRDYDYAAKHLDFLVMRRVIALGLANEFKIPDPSPENLKAHIKKLPIFIDESGKFSPSLYESALKKMEENSVEQEKLKKILCENYRIGEVETALAGPGVAFDSQVMDRLSNLYAEYDFIATIVSDDDIRVDEDIVAASIENFYGEHMDKYVQPPMYSVSAVRFPSCAFEKDVKSPEESELLSFFEENRQSFPSDVEFDAASGDVRAKYTAAEAMKLACSAAENFAESLCEKDTAPGGADLEEILKKFGLRAEKIPPFSHENPPQVDGIDAQLLLSMCRMDGTRCYSDPCQTADGAVVLLLDGKEEERQLPLDEVRVTVREDVIRAKKMAAFADKIERIRREILVGLSAGEDIVQILHKNSLSHESFRGISIGNADEKGIDLECKYAIASFGKNDKVRLISCDKNRVKMLIITGRNEQRNDFATHRIREMELAIKILQRQNFLFDFFNSQAEKFSRQRKFL
ncbi:MAG: peptidyl-prolyl cis-trans isomerase [Puniceicoccales bacterium]|jgi:peptidyl-prolyl cis-trans isomerase D|nr:peptidyl-prolyl cis-trans isomerase [Puniceicoccales bacterium]